MFRGSTANDLLQKTHNQTNTQLLKTLQETSKASEFFELI